MQAHLNQQEAGGSARPELSMREREVLLWLGRGFRPKAIADRLGICRVTVDLHVTRARRKLKASTATHAVAIAMTDGLIAP